MAWIFSSLFKIFPADTELCFCSFSVNIYKVTGQFPWSSLRETDRGISTEFSVRLLLLFSGFLVFMASCHCAPFWRCFVCQFPIWKTNHTLKWEGVWRELGCLARTASFAVREESGHSLKSSLAVCMHYNKDITWVKMRSLIFWSYFK